MGRVEEWGVWGNGGYGGYGTIGKGLECPYYYTM